jgi:hypothetical protein
MKKQLITLSIFATILLGCNKTKVTVTPTDSQKTYITKLTNSGSGTFTYAYDSKNNLVTEAFVSKNEAEQKSYLLKNIISETTGNVMEQVYNFKGVSTADDFKIVSTYNAAGKIVKRLRYNVDTGKLLYTYLYEYSGKTVKIITQITPGVQNNVQVFIFDSEGKNATVQQSFDANNKLVNYLQYNQFDNKKNIGALFPYGYSQSPDNQNNAAEIKVFENEKETAKYTYLFEYNADGYPIKYTASHGGIASFEYQKR